MRTKLFAVLSMVFFLAGISWGAPLFGFGGERKGGEERRLEKIAKEIGLTQEQTGKYRGQAKQLEEEAKAIRDKNKALFSEIEKELAKDAPDSKIINALILQVNQNRTQLQLKRMDQIIEIRKALTPEQKSKFGKMIEERKERRVKERVR